eukprot:759076-Hanusia_phi.AAC.9
MQAAADSLHILSGWGEEEEESIEGEVLHEETITRSADEESTEEAEQGGGGGGAAAAGAGAGAEEEEEEAGSGASIFSFPDLFLSNLSLSLRTDTHARFFVPPGLSNSTSDGKDKSPQLH